MSSSSPDQNESEPNFAVLIDQLYYKTTDDSFELSVDQLTIKRGEKVVLTGPSGSGKTTLLAILSGIKTGKAKTLQVLGKDLQLLDTKQATRFRLEQIGRVFQDFQLIEYLTVRDNIALSQFLSDKQAKQNAGEHVESIAQQLQLDNLLNRYPHQLSQGEKQRVAIGRAIFPSPALILADEPTGNLDSENSRRTIDYLFQVTESCQATLILVTHDNSLLPNFQRHLEMPALCVKQESVPN